MGGGSGERKVLRLHVGCGGRVLPGYTHVDVVPHEHVDIIADVRRLPESFDEGSVDEIYACHVLEHVSRHEVADVLAGMYRILAPGGTLRIAVPDIGKAMQMYVDKRVRLFPDLYGLLWGGQRSPHDFHHAGFDSETLREMMRREGFESIDRYDWKDFLPAGYDDYSRCYIPHMDVEGGELVSLNMVARKPDTEAPDPTRSLHACT
jgi:predicted SAM-dependent methyltransferase